MVLIPRNKFCLQFCTLIQSKSKITKQKQKGLKRNKVSRNIIYQIKSEW